MLVCAALHHRNNMNTGHDCNDRLCPNSNQSAIKASNNNSPQEIHLEKVSKHVVWKALMHRRRKKHIKIEINKDLVYSEAFPVDSEVFACWFWSVSFLMLKCFLSYVETFPRWFWSVSLFILKHFLFGDSRWCGWARLPRTVVLRLHALVSPMWVHALVPLRRTPFWAHEQLRFRLVRSVVAAHALLGHMYRVDCMPWCLQCGSMPWCHDEGSPCWAHEQIRCRLARILGKSLCIQKHTLVYLEGFLCWS